MATTAWPTAMDADDLSSGKDAKEITDTPMEFLWKRDRVVEQACSTFDIGGTPNPTIPTHSVGSAPWVTVVSRDVWIPEHYLQSRSIGIKLTIGMWAVGGGTASYRVAYGAYTGSEQTTTSATVVYKTSELAIQSSVEGALLTITVEGGHSGGSGTEMTTDSMMCNLHFGDV